MVNTKPIPIVITLVAALISCVVSIVQRVEFSLFVARLLIVVVSFLVMGTVIKMILDYSFKTLEPEAPIDEAVSDINDELDEEDIEEDISSTDLQEPDEG